MKKRTIVSLVLALTLVLFAVPASAAEVPPVEGVVFGTDVSVDSLPAPIASEIQGDVDQVNVVPMNEDGSLFMVFVIGEEQKMTPKEFAASSDVNATAQRSLMSQRMAITPRMPEYSNRYISGYVWFLDKEVGYNRAAGEWRGWLYYYYDIIGHTSAVTDVREDSEVTYFPYKIRCDGYPSQGQGILLGDVFNQAQTVLYGGMRTVFTIDYEGKLTQISSVA